MSMKPPVKYRIPVVVQGDRINLYPFKGNFIVRRVSSMEYKVDHFETGFLIATSDTREGAIESAVAILREKGQTGLDAAIQKATDELKKWAEGVVECRTMNTEA